MKRWSIAALLLAAACAPEPTPPAEYRVAFDVPPVEAALWFADRYPEFFTSGETGLQAWLDTLDAENRRFVLAMAQTLTWTWVDHESSAVEQLTPEVLGHEAIVIVRAKTLNQLELELDRYTDLSEQDFNAYVGAPEFSAGVFARLVRGGSNCEGQNHLVAVLLNAALEHRYPWGASLRAGMVGVESGHELVSLTGPTLDKPIFVDAWSNLPVFTVETRHTGAPMPVVAGQPVRRPLPAAEYLDTRPTFIELLPAHDAPRGSVDLVIEAPPIDELRAETDPWRLFLFARVLHLYDDPRASEFYSLVIERHCTYPGRPRSYVCAASRRFAD